MISQSSGFFVAPVGDAPNLISGQPTELMRLNRNSDGDLVITINREAKLEELIQLMFTGRVAS